ncbi:MAG: hypothetical protein ACUVXA_17375 [Candidatus Jordarchaeum sp.]|uniref:hypothetical protein n=1 Tax=Candidatus Jordarchaeum sp. TaxID=2823881 RepID=UPI00404B44FB
MFEKRGVCFAIFDEEAGPISVYFKGIDKTIADKIALKSMVGSLSLSQEVNEGESIIPLQEEHKSAFVFYFSIADEAARGGVRIGTLNFVVDKEEGDALYRFAPILSEHSKRIVQDIKKYYVYRQTIPQVLKDSVESILNIRDFERAFLPTSFKEYLIRSYLSKDTAFHRSIVERTSNYSRNEEILGDKIDILGSDDSQQVIWLLLSRDFLKMSNEEKRSLYSYLDKLRENISSLEIIFVLNEVGLRRGGSFDEEAIEKITQISRTSKIEGKEFDLYGMDNDENIVWALLSTNFLAMNESQIDELNKNIYRLKRINPSMEAFFVLAEILRSTKLQPPKPDFEGKPLGLRRIMGAKTEYQSLIDSLRKKEKDKEEP